MSLASVLAAAAIAVPAVVHADVYKWVDEKGSVTYGNVPPPGAKKLTQVDEDNGRVSTVPGISPEQLAWQRQMELEQRLARLERELAEQRAREAMIAAQAYPAYPPYYGGYGYGGFGYAVYPAYFRSFSHRFVARPAFVPRAHIAVRPAPARGMRR